MPLILGVLVMRAARSFAYGGLAVVLAGAMVQRGFSPVAIGALISVALATGALTSAATGTLASRFGMRTTLVAGGALMILAAALLAGPAWALALACALGVVSPGAQDVGPHAAIEQVALANESSSATRRLSWYNVVAASAVALGALAAAKLSYGGVLTAYAAAGAIAILAAPAIPNRHLTSPHEAPSGEPRSGVVERLAALFALDAFAGGFVVQAFIAYWFGVRFGVGPNVVGPLLFAANALAALSFLLADRIAARIGLLRTMVFTHLPSNVLLCLVPLMPNLTSAATVLLARFALSQMDVPTRQAYTLALVPPHDRARAAGVTAAVRPAAAAVAPILTGVAFHLAAVGLPFIIAGGLKIVYDLTLLVTFRAHPVQPEKRSTASPWSN